jgi:hypothetical protein
MERQSTNYLVVHCSASPPGLDIGAAEIRQWHKVRGWSDIGYHFILRRDGRIEEGRPADEVGCHVKGHNSDTLALCLVGGVDQRQRPQNNFTDAQRASLRQLVGALSARYPQAKVIGHRDFPGVAKACPCFDAIGWARRSGFPATEPLRTANAAMLKAVKIETEDGDEADSEMSAAERLPRTSGAQWLTALGGFNGGGLGFGLFAGMDWIAIAVLCGFATAGGVAILIAMGNENRQKLWKRIVG